MFADTTNFAAPFHTNASCSKKTITERRIPNSLDMLAEYLDRLQASYPEKCGSTTSELIPEHLRFHVTIWIRLAE